MACTLPSRPPFLHAALAAAAWFAFAGSAPAAATEQWSEVLAVNPRAGATLVHVGGRVLLIGGGGNAPGFDQVWSLDPGMIVPEWVLLHVTGTQTPIFQDHTAIYDPVGERVIVFGGYGPTGDPSNETWELTLGPSPTWSQLVPGGTPPDPRVSHTAIYDPVRQRMIVFGGRDLDFFVRDDVWALSLTRPLEWTQIVTAPGPPAREEAVAIYDPIGDRMLVSTGYSDGPYLADTWALSLGPTPAWTPIAATGPAARYAAVAVYDPSGARMILTGGSTATGPSDAWALSLVGTPAWSPLAPGGVTPQHVAAAAAYDPLGDRMLVFCSGNQLWSLTLDDAPAWAEIHPSNAAPGFRTGHAAVRDAVRHRMLVIGGYGSNDDVWALSLDSTPTWSPLTVAGTPVIDAAVYDPSRDRVVAHAVSSAGNSEIYEWNLGGAPTWSLLTTSGTPPGSFFAGSMVYDPARDRLVLIGIKTGAIGETWELTLSGTPTWSEIVPIGVPAPPRYDPALMLDPVRDRLLMFGGYGTTGGAELDDLWELNFSNGPQWTQLFPAGTGPSRRQSATATYDPVRDRMVLFGGVRFQTTFANVRYLSLGNSPVWSAGPSQLPGWGRANHSAIYDPTFDRMVVFGGFFGAVGEGLADAWELDFNAPPLAVSEPAIGIQLSVPRPNPASGTVQMTLTTPEASEARIEVHDVAGRRLRVLFAGNLASGARPIHWDLRDQAGRRVRPGMYVLTLETAGQRLSRRIAVIE